MDIGAFSKCIKELIAEYDKVEVPDLGVFYAELMPASYSDRLTTINPPYRKMYFRKGEVSPEDASLLFDKIASMLGVTVAQAEDELKWCLGRVRSELDGNRVCTLPSLGKLKATAQYDYFFIPDDELDIYPDGIGLEPICLKVSPKKISSIISESAAEAKVPVDDISKDSPEEPTPTEKDAEETPAVEETVEVEETPAVEKPVVEEPAVEEQQKPIEQHPDDKHLRRNLTVKRIYSVLIIILTLVLVAELLYIFKEPLSPILDRLLYTQEELAIIRGH